MSGLCAVTLGGLLLLGQGEAFQLTWTHSVEKLEWREEWRVEGADLILEAASVQGSGAGMEPPPEAVFENGSWRWSPKSRHPSISAVLSSFTADWKLCMDGQCRPLRALVENADGISLKPCDG